MIEATITTAVVYHSGYGHTQRMAEAVAEGAAATLVAIDAEGNIPEDGWKALNTADAIIFGSPTYMGGPSWQFKKFSDASSKPWSKKNGRTRSLVASRTAPASTVTSSIRWNTSFFCPGNTAAYGLASA